MLALPAGERLTLRSGQQIAAFWMSPRPVQDAVTVIRTVLLNAAAP